MANIKVTLAVPLVDGHPVTFKAPAGCDTITGIKVYYPSGAETASRVFSFRDANKNDLSDFSNLFAAGAYVRVVLDIVNGFAYIQNPDTNAYLEGKFAALDAGKASTASYTATVATTWVGSGGYYYQDVSVPGILATDAPCVDILPGSDNAANILYSEAICKVFRATTSANSIRVWATEAIATAFPIQLKVVR